MFLIELLWKMIVTLFYAPSANTQSEYLTKTIDGELIYINKLEMNKMNSTKSIVSKRVRL